MMEKLRWAFNYEKVRHKYMKASILLEITAALLIVGLGMVAWALLMTFPMIAIFIRERTHADFIVPKSDKEMKQEAIAQGVVVGVRYVLYYIISGAVMYAGYKADLSYYKSFDLPKYMDKYPVSIGLFIAFGIVYTLMCCIETGLGKVSEKRKMNGMDITISVLFIMGFATYFSNGLYIQGMKWAKPGSEFGGITTNVLLSIGIVCFIVRLVCEIVTFVPGDFRGSTEEIFARARAKKRRSA